MSVLEQLLSRLMIDPAALAEERREFYEKLDATQVSAVLWNNCNSFADSCRVLEEDTNSKSLDSSLKTEIAPNLRKKSDIIRKDRI